MRWVPPQRGAAGRGRAGRPRARPLEPPRGGNANGCPARPPSNSKFGTHEEHRKHREEGRGGDWRACGSGLQPRLPRVDQASLVAVTTAPTPCTRQRRWTGCGPASGSPSILSVRSVFLRALRVPVFNLELLPAPLPPRKGWTYHSPYQRMGIQGTPPCKPSNSPPASARNTSCT